MPRTIMGYVLRYNRLHQAGWRVLSVAVFGLSAVPLELQRRIVNGLTHEDRVRDHLLAGAWAMPAWRWPSSS